MASGNRSGYGNWELDKGEINLDYCDVGLGLKIPWQQQYQQQQQQQHSSFSWLQNRQNQSTENSRSPSPTISGFSHPSRFGNGGGTTFTSGQRQELERQTIIYRYMMASMPVPPELLIPLSKFPSSTTTTTTSEVGRKTGVETRYGSRGGDPEPWRCRRTDGKKWRCSRDVAPDQKYCERHSHKSRPSRSRKPVEPSSSSSSSSFLSSSVTSLINSNTTSPVSSSCNPVLFTPFPIPKPSSSSFDLPSPPPQFNPLPRYPDWFMKKEVSPTAVTAVPASACLCPQQNTPAAVERRSCSSSHHQSCLLPRPFIDALSLDNHVDPKDTSTPSVPI